MPACWEAQSEFNTLKQCFDYIARLRNTVLAQDISRRIEEATNEYIQLNAGTSSKLTDILEWVDELHKLINSKTQITDLPQSEPSGNECDGAYIYYLNICLHRLCCGLRFLNFNASEKLKQSGGGGWSGMRCNETDSDLCHWLTKPSNPGSGMFAGGFSRDDLNGTSGNQIATKIGKQLDLNGDLYGFLLAALFLPPWLPEKTANACLFLRQLCDEISKTGAENKLPGEYADDYEAIKRICKKLIEAFPKLIKENNHGLLALAHNGSKDLSPYKVEQQFDDCFDFLKEYLPDLIESLEHMKRQSGSWTAENIKNVRTQGPFLYGFTFTDKCKPSNIESQGQSELTQAIEDVLRDLLELNQILNPTSHAVAIGLGVVSSLLVGGSAATAYFYPGILGSTIQMIVG